MQNQNQNGNITSWFNSEVRVISDIEGGDIHHFATKQGELPYKGKILVTGDLIDSTLSSQPVAPLKTLSYNIRNLIACVTNQNIQYVLGNRDLNKIKVYHLTTLNNLQLRSDNKYFNEFNSGTIPDGQLNLAYDALQGQFESKSINYNAMMNHWYTFWAPGLGKGRKWAVPVDYSLTPFYKRFNDIFGADNSVGTMSAQNLLQTIPYELFNMPIDTRNPITPTYAVDNDFKAFIVLYVFRIMLMPTIPSQPPSFNIISSLRGLLINFYNKGHGILYKIKNELIVFSHGGLTSNFSIQAFYNILNQLPYLSPQLTNASVVNYNQQGGNIYTAKNLINEINKFNILLKTILNKVYKGFTLISSSNKRPIKPSNPMLFLLIITAPFDCKLFQTKLLNGNHVNCGNIIPIADLGPIPTGIREIVRNPLKLSDSNLMQIFGHYSAGIGAAIADVSISSQQFKTILINLDITNTFAHTDPNVQTSKTMVIFNGINIHVYTFLFVTAQNMPTLYILPRTNFGPITIYQDLNQMTTIHQYIIKHMPDSQQKKRLFFHGITTNANDSFAIFSLNKALYGVGNPVQAFQSKYLIIPNKNPNWLQTIINNSHF